LNEEEVEEEEREEEEKKKAVAGSRENIVRFPVVLQNQVCLYRT